MILNATVQSPDCQSLPSYACSGGITVGPEQMIAIADTSGNRVVVSPTLGSTVATIAGIQGSHAVAFDAQGNDVRVFVPPFTNAPLTYTLGVSTPTSLAAVRHHQHRVPGQRHASGRGGSLAAGK